MSSTADYSSYDTLTDQTVASERFARSFSSPSSVHLFFLTYENSRSRRPYPQSSHHRLDAADGSMGRRHLQRDELHAVATLGSGPEESEGAHHRRPYLLHVSDWVSCPPLPSPCRCKLTRRSLPVISLLPFFPSFTFFPFSSALISA
jgi:hypothetical protein